MSAMPIGIPGWPEFAFCTASIASARMALAISARVAAGMAPIREPSFIVAPRTGGPGSRSKFEGASVAWRVVAVGAVIATREQPASDKF